MTETKKAATKEAPQETAEEKVTRLAAEQVAANTVTLEQDVSKQAAVDEPGAFEGQSVVTDHFSITTGDKFSRPLVNVSKRDWVGEPGLVIPGWQVDELIEALGEIKDLPDSPDVPKDEDLPSSTGGDPDDE